MFGSVSKNFHPSKFNRVSKLLIKSSKFRNHQENISYFPFRSFFGGKKDDKTQKTPEKKPETDKKLKVDSKEPIKPIVNPCASIVNPQNKIEPQKDLSKSKVPNPCASLKDQKVNVQDYTEDQLRELCKNFVKNLEKEDLKKEIPKKPEPPMKTEDPKKSQKLQTPPKVEPPKKPVAPEKPKLFGILGKSEKPVEPKKVEVPVKVQKLETSKPTSVDLTKKLELSKEIEDAINKQISWELRAFYNYLSKYSYFSRPNLGLNGSAGE